MLELLILKGWSADKVKDQKGGKADSILTISLSTKCSVEMSLILGVEGRLGVAKKFPNGLPF